MPTVESKSSSIPPHAFDCLSQFLTLLDGACKRYSVDVYNAQMANIRNNLWLAFVVLSACAAFFVQADIGNLLLCSLRSNRFDPFAPTIAFLLLFSIINALLAVLSGINASTGTNINEAYDSLAYQVTTFEKRGFLSDDVYRLKRTVLDDLFLQTKVATARMSERGKLIRSMAKRIKRSILFGAASVSLFLLYQSFS